MKALKAHLLAAHIPPTRSARTPQTASFLCYNYGRTLKPEMMKDDTVYALSEVFELVASSHNQYLNLMRAKIEAYHQSERPSDLPALKYLKQLLLRYIMQSQEVLQSFDNTASSKWPKSKEVKARATSKSLKCDFERLNQRAEHLHQECKEIIGVLMNIIALDGSNQQMLAAERVQKLTFMAFIFVPLSFTTSFFGMNLTELKSKLSIWVWFAFTAPLMTVAVAAFLIDMASLRAWLSFKRPQKGMQK